MKNKSRLGLLMLSCVAPLFYVISSQAQSASRTVGVNPPFDPYFGVAIENDSNLFAVSGDAPVRDPNGAQRLADNITTLRGGINLDYLFDRQQFYATLEGRRLEYGHFTNLDHSEYLAKLGLRWNLTSRFDGLVEFRRERRIITQHRDYPT